MIRQRLAATRDAVYELDNVTALIDACGDDWRPETAGRPQTSDPTANRAIYAVDTWAVQLPDLRKREAQLIDFIGGTLMLIEHVRRGLGDDYAAILDGYYIDCRQWRDVAHDLGVSVSTAKRKRDTACDWVDSIGYTNVLHGNYEL